MFNEKTWRDGEKKVQNHMKKEGYKIVYTNFSCVGVELDVVSILPKKVQIKRLRAELKKNKKGLKKPEIKKLKENFTLAKKQAKDILVVTEVKARKTDAFGKGFDAVTKYKRQNITRGVEFLLKQKMFQGLDVRVDVASVDDGKITYIENAF